MPYLPPVKKRKYCIPLSKFKKRKRKTSEFIEEQYFSHIWHL